MKLVTGLFDEKQSLLYRIAVMFIMALALSIGVYFISKGFDQRYFKYDSWGYYIYLPSFLIYHDPLTLGHTGGIIWQYDISHEFYQAIKLPNGNYVFGYTCGVALMELPFFLIAHLMAHLTGMPSDGYSAIYQIFIICSGIFWGLWGVGNIYMILSRYFSRSTAIITCLTVVLATNLFNYMTWENGMTHVYSFFLFSAILRTGFDFFEKPSYKNSLMLGTAIGLIILIRPTNILMAIPVFFIGIRFTIDAVIERIRFFISHIRFIIPAAIVAVIPFAIQMIYWKWATGHFLFNPYAYIGFVFVFGPPHLLFGLLGVHKGWLFYAPVMILALLGLMLFRQKSPIPSVAIWLYLAIHVWITYSWSTFDYGGCFGARPMIDTYPILAIPFAVCLDFLSRKRMLYIGALIFIALCTADNMFQTWKYEKGYLSVVGYSSKEVIKSYFNYDGYNVKTSSPETAEKNIVRQILIDKKQLIGADNAYSESAAISFDSIDGSYKDYLVRIEVTGKYPTLDILRGKHNAGIVFSQESNGAIYCWMAKRITAQTIHGDTSVQKTIYEKRLVSPFGKSDVVKCYVTDPSANKYEIDTIRVLLLKR